MYLQKLSPFWWTKNPRTILYFLRELTGVGISVYFLYIIFIGTDKNVPEPIHWIGLIAAILHSVTWFWVTMKISPIPLPQPARIVGFLLLIAAVIGVSYLLLPVMYVRIT